MLSSLGSSSSDEDQETNSSVVITSTSNNDDEEVDTFSGTSSGRKRKKTSGVWEFFIEKDGKIKCSKCVQTYSKSSGNSTLSNHLRKRHGIGEVNSSKTQATIDLTTGALIHGVPLSDQKKRTLTSAIVSWIIDSMTSFSAVENEKFVTMLNEFEPRYHPPSRVTISKRVHERMEDLRPTMIQYLDSLKCKFSATTDAWSSVVLKGYMAITLHWIHGWKMQSLLITFKHFPAPHTSDAICELMMDVLDQWKLSDKLIAITSDNGANVIKGLKLLKARINDKYGDTVGGNSFWVIRCLAHTVQLGVKEALKILTPELTKIRGLVIRCKKGICRQMFDQKKIELGFDAARQVPRYDTETRWGSTYELCISSHNLRAVFNALTNNPNLGLQDLKLDDFDWAKVFGIATFLQKAHEITEIQSSKSKVTLSLIPGMYTLLKQHCEKVKNGEVQAWISLECKEAANRMLNKLLLYDDLINSDSVQMAKLLDPRFKSDMRLMQKLRNTLIVDYKYGEDSGDMLRSAEKNKSKVLEAVFALDRADGDSTSELNGEQVNMDEVTNFFQFTSIPDTSADPLDWWKAAESRFPTIAQMARDYLAIQATSVACESTFSESGQLITSRRACMSEENIEASMLCRNWMRSNIFFE